MSRKVAVIFASAGAIGRAVAEALASHGHLVVATARTAEAAEHVASAIRSTGGLAEARACDAEDQRQVSATLDAVVERHGQLDVVFNGIGGRPAELGYPASTVEQPVERFLAPLQRIVGAQFLTAREGARRMKPGGAVVLLSATLSGMTARHMAGITAACGAVEALTHALAGDFGPAQVRVNCVRGSAMPGTRTIQDTFAGLVQLNSPPQMATPPLGRPITVAETAGAVAFLASEAASGIHGQVLTVCAGAFV